DGDPRGAGSARRAAVAARADGRRGRALPGAAFRHPRRGREGGRAGPRGCRADLSPARPRQRPRRGRVRALASPGGGAWQRARSRRRLLRGTCGLTAGIDTLRLTAEGAWKLLRAGEVSGSELFSAYREAIDEHDSELNCYLRVCEDPGGDGVP